MVIFTQEGSNPNARATVRLLDRQRLPGIGLRGPSELSAATAPIQQWDAGDWRMLQACACSDAVSGALGFFMIERDP